MVIVHVNIIYCRYLEDLSNIYHPETKPYIKTLQGLSLTIRCFGGEVPFFFLSSKYIIYTDAQLFSALCIQYSKCTLYVLQSYFLWYRFHHQTSRLYECVFFDVVLGVCCQILPVFNN